jgi:hypothetical protein
MCGPLVTGYLSLENERKYGFCADVFVWVYASLLAWTKCLEVMHCGKDVCILLCVSNVKIT